MYSLTSVKYFRFIPKHRAGKSAKRRINQIHLPGPKNRKGAIGTLNRHAGVCFKIPQVILLNYLIDYKLFINRKKIIII